MNEITNPLLLEIKTLLEIARKNVATQVNTELLTTYWKIGELIVRFEQNEKVRAEYGSKTLIQLSKELTKEFGKGFSRSNLQNMRNFYLSYEKCQSVTGKLSWTHYCELLSIADKDKRSFYEQEAINSKWSVRELKRQINTSLYERLLLSTGEVNKEKVYQLATKGIEMQNPSDIIKDPYVFEFLGLPEDKPIMESDLEKALVEKITLCVILMQKQKILARILMQNAECRMQNAEIWNRPQAMEFKGWGRLCLTNTIPHDKEISP